LRFGFPTISNVEFKKAPDGSKSLKVTGAGFFDGSTLVTVQDPVDLNTTELPTTFYSGERQEDGTVTFVFGTKKKLKKLVKPGDLLNIQVRTPATGFGNTSNTVLFVR
jgi:hypothetical protein